ncbi:MAG: putative oxidoreductase, partial [Rhodospirillaceae bacterium]
MTHYAPRERLECPGQALSLGLADVPPHVPSYYAATAHWHASHPPLAGEDVADVCVIGGGYTGLSTALHLAERG